MHSKLTATVAAILAAEALPERVAPGPSGRGCGHYGMK
jgi:hypothetical protein